jgi:hypothetical protein
LTGAAPPGVGHDQLASSSLLSVVVSSAWPSGRMSLGHLEVELDVG